LLKQPDVKNVPKDVSAYRIRQIDFQPYNSYYSKYAASGMSREEFVAHYDKFNAALLTD
jgi:hypothetical protein